MTLILPNYRASPPVNDDREECTITKSILFIQKLDKCDKNYSGWNIGFRDTILYLDIPADSHISRPLAFLSPLNKSYPRTNLRSRIFVDNAVSDFHPIQTNQGLHFGH